MTQDFTKTVKEIQLSATVVKKRPENKDDFRGEGAVKAFYSEIYWEKFSASENKQ